MRLYVICFAIGVCWLQAQAQLPVSRWYWLLAPAACVILFAGGPASPAWRLAQRMLAAACCVACGFLWAAWFAGLDRNFKG